VGAKRGRLLQYCAGVLGVWGRRQEFTTELAQRRIVTTEDTEGSEKPERKIPKPTGNNGVWGDCDPKEQCQDSYAPR
jgi:hypothetical protein